MEHPLNAKAERHMECGGSPPLSVFFYRIEKRGST
jgi:hypothetical protein